MWPFTKTRTKPIERPKSAERYAKAPFNIFFEGYVLDVIGELPESEDVKFERLGLQKVLGTQAHAWREVVREAQHLSETFDIAVLDLWFRNRENAAREGQELEPRLFAQLFVDNYLEPDSQVDAWPPGALDAAHARIAANGGRPRRIRRD